MIDYTTAPTADDLASELERLGATRRAYVDLEPRVTAGEPWALAEDFGNGPEASWGPREVLAHLIEMLPFWLGELERVVDGAASGPTAFGRIADDDVRIAMVGRDRTLPMRVLFARTDAGIKAWIERLPTLSADERAAVGVHPRLGPIRVDRMAGRFVAGHLDEHAVQLDTILAHAGR